MRQLNGRILRNLVIGTVAVALLGIAGARSLPRQESASALSREEMVARGEYLVTIGGCNDCHTPWKMGEGGPEPDMTRRLSGHPAEMDLPPAPQAGPGPWIVSWAATNTAFAGPWGVSFTANLTPDELTGLGAWNEEIFINTMRTGKHWGQSRPLLPPMPWFNYARMTDEDLTAVFTYLRSIPPITNAVPEPLPPEAPEGSGLTFQHSDESGPRG